MLFKMFYYFLLHVSKMVFTCSFHIIFPNFFWVRNPFCILEITIVSYLVTIKVDYLEYQWSSEVELLNKTQNQFFVCLIYKYSCSPFWQPYNLPIRTYPKRIKTWFFLSSSGLRCISCISYAPRPCVKLLSSTSSHH